MKTVITKIINLIPRYAIIPLLVVLLYQNIVYFGTKMINGNMVARDLTTDFDRNTSLIPAFSIIYVGCYLFWAFNYVYISKIGRIHFYKFVTTIYITYTVCAIIYCIFPTTIVRPEVDVNSFSTFVLNYIYISDTPTNLFPSMHCMVSWLCFIGLRGINYVPRSFKVVSFVLAALVCISTLVVKQHYVVDLISGIALAEIGYFLVKRGRFWQHIYNFYGTLNEKVNLCMHEQLSDDVKTGNL